MTNIEDPVEIADVYAELRCTNELLVSLIVLIGTQTRLMLRRLEESPKRMELEASVDRIMETAARKP